jgi:HPt (histidine-containing phosphotransfer) domain-containing protein
MSFDELLKSLQRDYLKSIPEKIKLIEGLIHAADTHNIRESFHKLKGTGRTYGLPEVSELAEIVETTCIQKPHHGVASATQALLVLGDIYKARQEQRTYAFDSDSRVETLRKLLQSE